ncbi:MAG: OmpH family outer membrane protein [Firmicutes bacterium]|nr:OmpH family outer membrane protein [Bacillota bacterium]
MQKRYKIIGLVATMVVLAGIVAGITNWSISRADKVASVGYVDMARLSKDFPDLKASRDVLEKETARLQGEYDKASASLSKDEKVKLFQEYQTKLDAKKESMLAKAFEKVNQTISQVAKEQGLSMVFDKQVVLYGGKDITSEVLKKATGK